MAKPVRADEQREWEEEKKKNVSINLSADGETMARRNGRVRIENYVCARRYGAVSKNETQEILTHSHTHTHIPHGHANVRAFAAHFHISTQLFLHERRIAVNRCVCEHADLWFHSGHVTGIRTHCARSHLCADGSFAFIFSIFIEI